MKFIFAPDSFKGSLTSREIIRILTEQAKEVFPQTEIVPLLTADGGEGTLEAILSSRVGTCKKVPVKDPLFKEITAEYGILKDKTAVVEMAKASGLTLVEKQFRNPLNTTTYGTGQLIADAIKEGCRKIIVGAGGSATNDGGIGVLSALGIKFLDCNGKELMPCGKNLIKICDIDDSGLVPLVTKTKFIVMCDIKNPLLGKSGAARVFAPQKGASLEDIDILERGMKNLKQIVRKKYHKDLSEIPGAGAAGGLAWGLCTFLNASMKSGIMTVLELTGFEQKLDGTDLVITGEGHADSQSASGKVLSGIGEICQKKGIPVIAVVGGMAEDAEVLYEKGITSFVTLVNDIMELEYAINNAEILLKNAAKRLFRQLKTGMEIRK